jgi:hypothetical protein
MENGIHAVCALVFFLSPKLVDAHGDACMH